MTEATSRSVVCLSVCLLSLAGCAENVETAASGAALAAPGAVTTHTPDEWSDLCSSGAALPFVGAPRFCHALAAARGDAERERAALALNLALNPTLGPKHFTHGARVVLSVDDALRLSAGHADPILALAVRDANRAFAAGIDHAVLDDWVTTPVCGRPTSDAISGLAGARCVALDSDCRRGRYDSAAGCCGETDMPSAMVCGEDGGLPPGDRGDDAHDADHRTRVHDDGHHEGDAPHVCDGRGGCVPASEVPQDVRAHGAWTWLETVELDTEPPVPSAWTLDDGRVELRSGGIPVAIVPASQVGHRTRIASSAPGTLGVVGLDMSTADPSVVRTILLPRRISLDTDLANGETYDVCAAHAPFDDLGALVGECLGDQRVSCPSTAGAPITCAVDPRGFSVLTGPNLALAWERDPPPTPTELALLDVDSGKSDAGPDAGKFVPEAGVATDAASNVDGGVDTGPGDDAASIDAAIASDGAFLDAPLLDAGVGGGTDASLPRFTDLRDPAPLARFVIFKPLGRIVPICAGPACMPTLAPVRGIFAAGSFGGCAGPATCSTPCGPGSAVCFNGHYGGCFGSRLEQCNGLDDDCDGVADEGADAFCDDGVACTDDFCLLATGSCVHDRGPAARGPTGPFGPLCHTTFDPTCVDAYCGALPDPSGLDPRDTVLSPDPNGCVAILEHSYCQDEYPLGFCGGARERCAPGRVGSDFASGCQDYCSPVATTTGAIDTTATGEECWGAYTPPTAGDPTGSLVVGFNESLTDRTVSTMGWVRSATGTSWAECNATQLGCGGTGSMVPPAELPWNWAGDPVVVADGLGSLVMLNGRVTVAYSGGIAFRQVSASVSTDGGRTFSSTTIVNDALRRDEPCSQAVEDQPAAYFDRDFPTPHLWVVWRHANDPTALNALGGCIRGGTVDATTGRIDWFMPAHSIDRMSEEGGLGHGQSGLRVVARRIDATTERVSVLYSTETGEIDCRPDQVFPFGPPSVSWEMVFSDSTDSRPAGVDWQPSTRIAHRDANHVCVDGSAPILLDGREFDVTVDRTTGAYWAAIHVDDGIGVYLSRDTLGWERVHLVDRGADILWLPSIAVDDQGRVAVTYYGEGPDGLVTEWLTVSAAGSAGVAELGWRDRVQLSSSFAPNPFLSRAGSDYMTVFPIPTGALGLTTFEAAWSESRPGQAELFATSITVSP